MSNLYATTSKSDEFLAIPYKSRTPEQRWAILCVDVRKQKRWRRSQLAEYFGVVTSTVCYWESGKTFPKNDIVYKMAELTGQSVNELVCYLNNTTCTDVKPSSGKTIYDLAIDLPVEELLEVINKLTTLASTKIHAHPTNSR